MLLACSPCRVWREAVSGVKFEPVAPAGRLTAQTLRRFDGSPNVVDATLQDIEDRAPGRVLPWCGQQGKPRTGWARNRNGSRSTKKSSEHVEPHPTRTN